MKVKKNNRFNSIFSSLSDTERSEFCEFLKLSFVKKPRLSGVIIDILESGGDLHSYLEEKYSERSMWNIYFELTRSVKQFISVKEIMENEIEMHKVKRLQLRKRNLNKLLIKEYKFNISSLRSSEFSFNTLKQIQTSALECSVIMSKLGLSVDFSDMYKLHIDHLVLNFLFELNSHLIEQGIRREFFNDQTDFLSQRILKSFSYKKVQDLILVSYPEYKTIFNLLSEILTSIDKFDNLSHFKKAKKIFYSNLHLFSDKYKSEIFETLINICILSAQKINKNIDPELFELLDSKLKNNLTDDFKNKKIGDNHFRDYVYIALNLDKVEWAENFIKKYSSYLPDELRENNLNTALAFISLHRNNYSEAVRNIIKLKRNYFIHDLDFYSIQIFAGFDSGNIVECLRIKKRFHEYIKKNSRLPESHKKGSLNFINILTDLINYKESGKRTLLNKIEYDAVHYEILFWRKWINEKIKEFKVKKHNRIN